MLQTTTARTTMEETTTFVETHEKIELGTFTELVLHTKLFLLALVKGRYRDRLLRLWTVFVLFAPLLAPVILTIMKEAGALVIDDIRLQNATYAPNNVSALSQVVLDGWRADATLLGFGPSNSDLAMNLSRAVCERLGVNFAGTRRVANDKEAENARLLNIDGIIMFEDKGQPQNFKLYHKSFQSNNQFAAAYQSSLNGHQLYVGEVAATSGILELQGAATQVYYNIW